MWIVMAVLSAFFAGITSILAKCGIRKTDSDVATALRTAVVLLFSWIMVAVVGSADTIREISPRSFLFLALSGFATGASWICYFKALSMGEVNKVVPIDKSSTVLSVLLAIVFLGEREHLALKLASTALIAVGIYLMIEMKPGMGKKDTTDSAGKDAAESAAGPVGKDAVESAAGLAGKDAAESAAGPAGKDAAESAAGLAGKDAAESAAGSAGKDAAESVAGPAGKDVAGSRRWMIYAALSAVFAALTSVLAKVGIMGVESNLGTALRTGVVLVMAWSIVFMRGKQAQLKALHKAELAFIVLSGLATGASWLCYYYAIQNGVVSVVVPIDKLSILVTVAFSFVVFRERMGRKALLGLLLMILGTLAMALGA